MRVALGAAAGVCAFALVAGGCSGDEPRAVPPVPDRSFRYRYEIALGDRPLVPLAIVEREDGHVDTLVASRIATGDTSVVRVVQGALVGARIGVADLWFDAGDRRVGGNVRVVERIFDGEVRLSAGEVRAWELGTGQVEITVTAARPGDSLRSLDLAAGLRCATSTRTPETIHCRVRTPTRLVLKHTAAHPDAETARVRIIRGPE